MRHLTCCLVVLLICTPLMKWITLSLTVALASKPRHHAKPTVALAVKPRHHEQPASIKMHDQAKPLKQLYVLLKKYDKGYPRCMDVKSVSDANKTKIEIKGANTVHLGGVFRLNAYLFDGYGKPKTVGGDHLRARLFTKSVNAYTVGSIYDHNNGTYSVHFTALWSGQATAEVELLYPREIIAAALYVRSAWDFSDISATFKNQNTTETTSCSPDIYARKRKISEGSVCEYSYWNKKILWLCAKPLNKNISCTHLKRFERNWINYTRVLNKCENEVANRWPSAVKTINVTITPKRLNKKQVTVDQPRTGCTSYNTTKLWDNRGPTGYFYEGKWKLRHCKGVSIFNGECLRNKRIYLWGDSTVFQWFGYIRDQGKCKCKHTEKGPTLWQGKWDCYCRKHNTSLIWMPHYMPFTGANTVNRHLQSLKQQFSIDRRFNSMERILVIHLYAHIQMYSLAFFANHLIQLRENIETLVNDDVKLRVFIKLPHTHREFKHKVWMVRQPDIIGYIYTNMIRTVFAGLYHRVIALDNRDATNAVRNLPLHPSNMVVKAMVGQLLSYVCNTTDISSE